MRISPIWGWIARKGTLNRSASGVHLNNFGKAKMEILPQVSDRAQHATRGRKQGDGYMLDVSRRLAVLIAIPLALGAQGNNKPKTEDKRILWIFTNHRTAEESANLAKLTPRGKFSIAWHDTTDQAIFLQSAFLAGIGQATNGNPSFGQGMEGYAKRFGAAYADFAIQNLMTEGIFPTILHQDPRYFRRSNGTGRSRLGYAISRLFITPTDS